MASKDKKLLEKMMDQFRLAEEAEAQNRKRGLAALKFRMGGDEQWDSGVLNIRRGDNRPSESYNQIPQFVHQVTNDMRMNMPQVKFIPGTDGSEEVAEIYEDLARCIQTTSEAEVALDTAADSQVTIGWGYLRLLTEYENSVSFDQIIKIGWIPNTFTVYDDPFATLQDRSDRKFLFQICDVPYEDFNREHDKKYTCDDFNSVGDNKPSWATNESMRVVEYWTVEEEITKLYLYEGGIVTENKFEGFEPLDTRDVVNSKVVWRKCTALEVLETKDWPGKFIPYVFVSGEEIIVDGKKVLTGLVEHMMPAQKQFNYWTNAATEMVALAPKAPYIMALGQAEGLSNIWDNANVKNYPYLPYKPTTVNGQLVGPPQRQQAEPPIQAMMAMVQQSQQNMYATTGIYPASLGKQGNESSGKAIMARQREGDVSTFHFTDNLARSIRFMGRCLADLIPKIYDAPRALRLLKEDRSDREVKVNQPFVDDNGEEKVLDLTVGTYDVAVTVGPNYTTKRQEAADQMTTLIQAAPQLMGVAGDLLVQNMDWPGADKLAERLKKTLPPGIADEPKKGDVPPELQAQMQQAQQMIDQLTETVHKLNDELDLKEADTADKQADAAMKQEQMRIDAEQAARQFELDKLDRAIKMQELQIKGKDLEIKEKQMQVGAVETGLNFIQRQNEIDNANIVDTNQ